MSNTTMICVTRFMTEMHAPCQRSFDTICVRLLSCGIITRRNTRCFTLARCSRTRTMHHPVLADWKLLRLSLTSKFAASRKITLINDLMTALISERATLLCSTQRPHRPTLLPPITPCPWHDTNDYITSYIINRTVCWLRNRYRVPMATMRQITCFIRTCQ